jgi:hypothetical protein
MEANMPTKIELEEENNRLRITIEQLENQVPEHIVALIEESEAFDKFKQEIEGKEEAFKNWISKIETFLEEQSNATREQINSHISSLAEKTNEINKLISHSHEEVKNHTVTLQQKCGQHMATLNAKGEELALIFQQHQTHADTIKKELEDLENNIKDSEQEAIEAIGNTKTTSTEALETKLEEHINTFNEECKNSINNIEELTEAFKKLAGSAYYNKSSDKVADEYRKNAQNHKKDETKFQYIGGGSIIGAIVILLVWLGLGIWGWVSTETEYHWLPVATITSLLIFLSRWSARIAYRHGLEARRLNQFALELTAMPAFFAQELLNQGDTEFQTEGKKIVQEKSSKMFGNFERFDEQHSHSPMELLWKWMTKKFETAENNSGVSSLSEQEPVPKSKTAPRAKPKQTPPSTE